MPYIAKPEDRVALIDADSMIYIIAWNHREMSYDEIAVQSVCNSFDSLFNAITDAVKATHYAGFFSCPSSECFRKEVYRVGVYKGGRTTPEWVELWKPVIIDYATTKYKFAMYPALEADDALGLYAAELNSYIICSPDKDLNQIPGEHFSYKEVNSSINTVVVSPKEADKFFWKQMLMGDDTDGVIGIPKVGEVSAEKILAGSVFCDSEEDSNLWYRVAVKEAYVQHYGKYYGPIIFEETYQALHTVSKTQIEGNPIELQLTCLGDVYPVKLPDKDLELLGWN